MHPDRLEQGVNHGAKQVSAADDQSWRISGRIATRPGRRAARTKLLALTLALAFSGCVHYQDRLIDPAVTASEWMARSLHEEGLRRFLTRTTQTEPGRWPLREWTLDQLTLAAIYEQPSLAVARAQWDAAGAGVTTAREHPNPSVTAGATYNSTTPPPWIPAISFDIPIETAGKRGHRIAQAEASAEAARWDWVDKIWQVRANVRSALLQVHFSRETAKLLELESAAQAEVVRLLEGQWHAGEVSAAEVTPARIALSTGRLGLQQAHQQESEAVAALAEAIGVPASALADVTFSLGEFEQLDDVVVPADAERDAMLRRADVRSALASYAASQAALQGEIAKQYPDINLGPGYEFDQTDNKWSLAVTLPLPIFNRNEGPIAEAEAKRRLAAAQFVATQAKAISEVELALASYRHALARANTAADLMREVRQRLESVRAMRKAGETDSLAVATAEVESSSSATQYLDSVNQAQQALGRLEAAMQSPLVISPQVLGTAATTQRAEDARSHEK